MKILVLLPRARTLAWSMFADGRRQPRAQGTVADYRGEAAAALALQKVFQAVAGAGLAPELVAVYATETGERFSGPVRLDAGVAAALAELVPQSPLLLPALRDLVRVLIREFPAMPALLVPEGAFFRELPAREKRYAIPPAFASQVKVARSGCYGLWHAAAAAAGRRELYERIGSRPARIISLCLEPRPELAAILGGRPVFVTGGVSPLDGLPGENCGGGLDPGIILRLVRAHGWGPEQINEMLQRKSGLRGVAGKHLTIAAALDPPAGADRGVQLAGDFFRHRILQAVGSGLAALGGIDGMVYSGRYAGSGLPLHAWLTARLRLNPGLRHAIIGASQCRDALDRLVADAAAAAGGATGRHGARTLQFIRQRAIIAQ